MRLDRLRIPSYRNLRGFEIDFDESRPTTVLLAFFLAPSATARGLLKDYRQYGRGKWRKPKGFAQIRLPNGRIRMAELHLNTEVDPMSRTVLVRI